LNLFMGGSTKYGNECRVKHKDRI